MSCDDKLSLIMLILYIIDNHGNTYCILYPYCVPCPLIVNCVIVSLCECMCVWEGVSKVLYVS